MTEQVFSFGGHDLSSMLFVCGVRRCVHPRRSIGEVKVPGMDGALCASTALEPVDLTVTCALRAETVGGVADIRRALAGALSASEPAPLVLPDEPTTYVMALFAGGGELGRSAHSPTVELAFRLLDPVAYGHHRSEAVSGAKWIRVGGTYPARPVITAKPPAGKKWRVSNRATGEHVSVAADFDGAQTLVLDFLKERCTINGADARIDMASDYFSISGDVELAVSGGTATIEWDERWL